MRRSFATLLACWLPLAVAGCSLVVDFPAERTNGARDAALDAGRDGGTPDARSGEAGPDATASSCEGNNDCKDDELCCDRRDGNGSACVKSSDSECSACNVSCSDPRAPNCGKRKCECKAGSGEGCLPGQFCMGSGADARCVECVGNSQCDTGQCVNNVCVQCTRGANLESSGDDEGCGGNTPICNEKGVCVACSASPNNCANNLQCVAGVGCVGCDAAKPVDDLGSNGCPRTLPICQLRAGGVYQCFPCRSNAECGGGYCDVASGMCTNACDPGAGETTCPSGSTICKRQGSDFACVACSPIDCASGKVCATDGPQKGNCVQCTNNAQCPQAAPTCNLATGTCSACTGGKVFDNASGQCVECTSEAHCATNADGRYCHPTRKECVPCTDLPVPNAPCMNTATPQCGAGGVCTGCANDAACATATPATPFCVSGTCSACTAITPTAMADTRCAAINAATPVCLASGSCAVCDTAGGTPTADRGCAAPNDQCEVLTTPSVTRRCVPCVVSQGTAVDEGCSPAAPDCVNFAGVGNTCTSCDPTAGALPTRCIGPLTCSVSGSVTSCSATAGGGILPPITVGL